MSISHVQVALDTTGRAPSTLPRVLRVLSAADAARRLSFAYRPAARHHRDAVTRGGEGRGPRRHALSAERVAFPVGKRGSGFDENGDVTSC